jgi:hypothetical protein
MVNSQSQGSIEKPNKDVQDSFRLITNPKNEVKVFDFTSFKKIVTITLVLNNLHLRHCLAEKHKFDSLLVSYQGIYLKH